MILNHPDLWISSLPQPSADGHKYNRGHTVIFGAPELTGATRLAAESCARMGAGLVTVIGGDKADIYRATLPAHILVRDQALPDMSKVTACLMGSGGMPAQIPQIPDNIPVIRDAEAITPGTIFSPQTILTPHDGEFARAFPHITGTRAEKAMAAAKMTGAVMVYKGAQTVIAHPDGRAVVNDCPVPYLATAGSGDVLAGMMTGLAAQGMKPFESALAGVYIHAHMAKNQGAGLVASDLLGLIPGFLRSLGL
ncbi:MAG: NAD(P)H-hydrate dehydratase [Alphaproteobacteria bacterium]|nr:NAD(P)H-hydrate dehydratase [Alphaproteobacteria bacterium]